MAYTQTQLDALEAAIAEGVLTVQFADRQVTYRSLAEMERIRGQMIADLGQTTTTTASNRRLFAFSKGL